VFGVEKLPLLKSNAGASEIVKWKQSDGVAECFRSLFVQNKSGVYWIDLITRNAFSMAAVPTLTHNHYAFTLAVCNIILNPRSRSVKCTEKRMKCRMEKFLNNYNSGGPSYGSAEAIMDEELEVNERRSQMNSPQTDYEPEPLSRTGSSMQYSEEEIDEAFRVYE
ncbi:5178_t:CDS:2, partial [Gigaspora margarita]